MKNDTFVFAAMMVAFLIFITARGNLRTYLNFLVG